LGCLLSRFPSVCLGCMMVLTPPVRSILGTRLRKAKSGENVLKYRKERLLQALRKFMEDNGEKIDALMKKRGTKVLDWIPKAWSLIEGVEYDEDAEIGFEELKRGNASRPL